MTFRTTLPRPVHACRVAGFLLAASAVAVPAAAQTTTYVSGQVVDAATGAQDLQALLGAASLTTHAALPGASAAAAIDVAGGAAHLYAGTSGSTHSATASAAFGYHVTLTNTGGPATVAPMQLFLDGIFRQTIPGSTDGTPYANVIGRAWDINSGRLVSSVDLWLFGDDATPAQHAWDALLLPRPAIVGGATTFRIDWSYTVAADAGWEADFQNTARIFFPTVNGIAWAADAGVLTQQARPVWAQDERVDYEVDPSSTTTPEPMTVALLGTGLLALGAVARRRRV
jgi:hypothetical protein